MLHEICKCMGKFRFLNFLSCGVPYDLFKFSSNALVWLPVGSTFTFGWISSVVLHCWRCWRHFYVCDKEQSFSVAKNFIQPQSAANYGSYALNEFGFLFTVFFRRSRKAPYCRLWRSTHFFEICCHWRKVFPCRFPNAGSPRETGELLLEEGAQVGLQEVSWLRELCVADYCCEVCDRPRVELLLPSYFGWWRQTGPYETVWQVAWWTLRERLGEGRGDVGLQVRIPVVCARAEETGEDFSQKPP